LPEIQSHDPSRSAPPGELGLSDALAWVQERWVLIAGLALVLIVMWLASAEPRKNGRYLLVKDDVPCEGRKDDEDGRRWCYLVLDTQSGVIEERARKVRAHD
jgi:hypothetical protein